MQHRRLWWYMRSPNPCTEANGMKQLEWTDYARQLLKDLMHVRRVTYKRLAGKLDMDHRALTNKINRGQFSFTFFLRCVAALDLRLSEVPWRTLEEQNPPPLLPATDDKSLEDEVASGKRARL